MARWLKQSTSIDVPIGPFLDDTDGKTAETALTLTQPDIRLKKNGGAWAQKNAAQTLSHEENGYYEVTLDATDTNTLGLLRLAVAEVGALPLWEDFLIVPANVWDSLFGSDKLQVDIIEVEGTTPNLATLAEIRTEMDDALIEGFTLGTVVADGGNTAQTFKTDLTAGATDYWRDTYLLITSGALIGQVKRVTGFNFTTDFIALHAALTGVPAAGVTFRLINR